ncbi:DUF4123 domain-containing protein [Massilia sp. PAMC28688]|uniref:DUF4123 domain-containing protein n=1 Tax=Massilia sp. PAMC28688 TaxID=2861283 RepID=UPI001C635990|nr:DUF4123 domain-containing protein [Massilia sp. PAMC28688]QYF95413.1 DUF4123 domain-containing protein [Massilia sp. PAMC28688]
MSDSLQFDHHLLARHRYALIEPSMAEYLPDGIVAEPIVPEPMAASAHLMPRLLDLRALAPAQNDALLTSLFQAQQNGEAPIVSMLVQTEADARAFITHWNGLQYATAAGGGKVWLRVHDPRVMHQLLRILTAGQRRKLFGPIEQLAYFVGATWVQAPEAPAAGTAAVGTAWNWARVERIGLVNRALQAAGVQDPQALWVQGERAERLIDHATLRHQLTAPGDLVEFAMRGLLHGDAFDRHPQVAAAIPPSSDPDDDSTLADRLALLDDHVWDELSPHQLNDTKAP